MLSLKHIVYNILKPPETLHSTLICLLIYTIIDTYILDGNLPLVLESFFNQQKTIAMDIEIISLLT